MTVNELNREQLDELKQGYIVDLMKEFGETPSYEELVQSQNISDEKIFSHYKNVIFNNDDFFCTAGNLVC